MGKNTNSASKDKLAAIQACVNFIVSQLEDAKAEAIISIDISGKSALADHMIIASGRSQRHVTALADHLLHALKDADYGQAKVEGLHSGDWVLIDTGDIIVHLFRPEIREFYNLEKLWQVPELEKHNKGQIEKNKGETH